MESTSAHYLRVFLSLVNLCDHSDVFTVFGELHSCVHISYCCVQSLLSTGGGGECSDN